MGNLLTKAEIEKKIQELTEFMQKVEAESERLKSQYQQAIGQINVYQGLLNDGVFCEEASCDKSEKDCKSSTKKAKITSK